MDLELFLKWLHHFILYAHKERPLPLDIAVFNPLKTAFSTLAARLGLVRGDLVVGKKQFSSLLKSVYPTAVTAQTIKAGIRKAEILPLSRGAVVRILPSADSSSTHATPSATPSSTHATPSSTQATPPATPSSTHASPSATQTPCPTFKRVTPKNYLVAAGVIPESLANVLMSVERSEKVRHRIPLPARVIDQYFNLMVEKEAEEKEKEEKKRKRKEEMAKKEEEKRQAQEAKRQKKQAPPMTEEEGEHCAICKKVVPPRSDDTIDEWVQCDLCNLWFHLECAGVEEVPDTDWLCHKCCLST
ncbi:unnamed protein product [Leuciscus chuanchicus]